MYSTRPLLFQGARALRASSRPSQDQTHRAHTISQRIRQLKKIPPELIPLGIVLAVAIGAAGYSLVNKAVSDKTLRWSRQGKIESLPSKIKKEEE